MVRWPPGTTLSTTDRSGRSSTVRLRGGRAGGRVVQHHIKTTNEQHIGGATNQQGTFFQDTPPSSCVLETRMPMSYRLRFIQSLLF